MIKKILITGFTGMLGRSIVKKISKNKAFKLYGIARTGDATLKTVHQLEGDLTDRAFIQSLKFLQPDIIIHTSALVDLNLCEEKNGMAEELNVEAGKSLAKLFPDAHFLYISTDSVFDGVSGNYKEDMPTNPINYYNHTKRDGELAVQAVSKHALILRTNIYGHKLNGKSLFDWAYQALKDNRPIKGFSDVYFNPLYTGQVAEVIEYIITKHPNAIGILHLGAQDQLNKYEFLRLISKVFHFDNNLITRSSIKDIAFKVERPFNTTLNTSKLNAIIKKQYSVEKGLEALKRNLKAA